VEEDIEPEVNIIPAPPPAYSDDQGASASACRDALNKAVLDFEETFQRTHKRSTDTARAEFFACFQGQHPEAVPLDSKRFKVDATLFIYFFQFLFNNNFNFDVLLDPEFF
jgi:hypothetical protein